MTLHSLAKAAITNELGAIIEQPLDDISVHSSGTSLQQQQQWMGRIESTVRRFVLHMPATGTSCNEALNVMKGE